jgi:hypothetical protein
VFGTHPRHAFHDRNRSVSTQERLKLPQARHSFNKHTGNILEDIRGLDQGYIRELLREKMRNQTYFEDVATVLLSPHLAQNTSSASAEKNQEVRMVHGHKDSRDSGFNPIPQQDNLLSKELEDSTKWPLDSSHPTLYIYRTSKMLCQDQ